MLRQQPYLVADVEPEISAVQVGVFGISLLRCTHCDSGLVHIALSGLNRPQRLRPLRAKASAVSTGAGATGLITNDSGVGEWRPRIRKKGVKPVMAFTESL